MGLGVRLWMVVGCLSVAAVGRAEFQAGATITDVTPPKLPVLVNGGMLSRSLDKVRTHVNARTIVVSDGKTRVVLMVVDSCMMGRPLLDDVKALAAAKTGIPSPCMLISATHTHSAPSSMGALGTEADLDYVAFLRDRLVESIAEANGRLQPAKIGFARIDAPEFTALRQWVRRPDRLAEDPFGNKTVRANMHAGANWDDVTGEAGPEDPELSLISIQSLAGKPLAVLANFSMHYFGDADISADYFGLFAEGLKTRLAPESDFVGIMSHGCSGDIYRVDYKIPTKERPNPTISEYTNGLLDLALKAYAGVEYSATADVAMAEQRLPLQYRVPDTQRLEWAKRVLTDMGTRPPKTTTEVYAREQPILHEMQSTEVVVQALRIGEMAIATTPNETYAITGLKIKAASPLPNTMVIELANGGDGYIPPPEQHPLGGYNTWAARSAGLEVQAEPKIAQAAIALLETVANRPRRTPVFALGPASLAVQAQKPLAWWRLNEFSGPHAVDFSPRRLAGLFEPGVLFHLDGPDSAAICGNGRMNRCPHFAGGRMRAVVDDVPVDYTLSFWIWNGMPAEGRDVAGWCYSRDHDQGISRFGEHLGVGGSGGNTGRLIFQTGDDASSRLAGRTEIPRWTWRHVALVRTADEVRAHLNGELEFSGKARSTNIPQFFFGGRSDNRANWEGRLDEIAIIPSALSVEAIRQLAGAK